ncbi:MAG: hypothetical protein M1824_002854 [Vezdaea acicularis]|nr:MAG: hypothetical protein M1824_002854 [Vezdaea acicularis]
MRVRLSIKQRWPHYEAATAATGPAPAKPKRGTTTSIATATDIQTPKLTPEPRKHPTPIERLPPELCVLILSHLPNFCDLWSAISASPHLAAAYQAYRRYIKGCVVNSLLGREPLHAHGTTAVADLLHLEVYEQEAGGEFLLLGRSANDSLQAQICAFRSQSERELYIAEHRVRFRSQRPRPRLPQINTINQEETFTFVAPIPDRLSRLVPATQHLSRSFYTGYAKADAAAASGANPSALYAHSANDSGRPSFDANAAPATRTTRSG